MLIRPSIKILCLVAACSFTAFADDRAGNESIDQVIRSNLGTAEGVQHDPTMTCKFEVSETQENQFLLMLELNAPNRMIGSHFSGDSRFFWFDSRAHTITFDRTSWGRANIIYKYDPTTLKFHTIEEDGEETCSLKQGT